MQTRKAINEIIPGKLYQRGQILSWSREDKLQMLKERGINIVVNMWPKIDSDFSDSLVDLYMYMPVARSKNMTSYTVRRTARAVADILVAEKKHSAALVLCEAGKTRSVFFCVLLASLIKKIDLADAYEYVEGKVPGHKMKDFMREYCQTPNR